MERCEESGMLKKLPWMISAFGYVNYIIQRKVETLDNGFVLIADDEAQARQFAEAFCSPKGCNAVRIYNWKKKSQKPRNYEVGVLLIQKEHRQPEVESFLNEKDFLPVIVSGGILPDYLKTGRYLFRLSMQDVEIIRGNAFYEWMIAYQEYVRSNKDGICRKLEKLHSSMAWDEYYGDVSKRRLYELLLATVSIIADFIWDRFDEREASVYRSEGMEICRAWLNQMDDFSTGEDLAERVADCVTEYLDQNPSVLIRSIDHVDLETSKAISNDEALLYDAEFYYIPQSLFMKMCAPLLETVSTVELKQQMAAEGLLKKTSEDYTSKKMFTNVAGSKTRIRVFWIFKECLILEDNLTLEDLYEEKCEGNLNALPWIPELRGSEGDDEDE